MVATTTSGPEDSTTQEPTLDDVFASVDNDDRTVDKDKAAREILNWYHRNEYPMPATEMEERGEYSAQHYRNVKKDYFNDGEKLEDATPRSEMQSSNGNVTVEHDQVTVEIPEDVDLESYVRGWLAGRTAERGD